MIPHPHRQKGSGPQLGATGPGQTGPFGPYGTDEDDDPDEPSVSSGTDGEQHDHRVSVRTTDGSAADNLSAANDTTEGTAP